MEQHSLLFDHLSFERERDENGSVVLRVFVKKEHLFDDETVVSGLFSVMLDTAIGTVVSQSLDGFGVTIQLSLHVFDTFKKDYFICKAAVRHSDSNLSYGEGTIFDPDGKVAAKAQASFKVIPRKK